MHSSRFRFSVLSMAAALILALLPSSAWGVSASPQLTKRAEKGRPLSAQLGRSEKAARSKGIDAPSVDRVMITRDAQGAPRVTIAKTPASTGELKSIAILVGFSDVAGQVPAASFDSLLFADTYGPASLRGYYKEVSYGALDVTTGNLPSSVGWSTLPESLDYYVDGVNGLGDYPRNAQGMVEDAILAVDGMVDFSQYDNDGDGFVENLIVIHAGSGAEATGSKDDIWSHKWSLSDDHGPGAMKVDGVSVDEYSTEPEYWYAPGDMTTGVFAHEVGHILGLPDLYDRTGASEGIGDWSLMAAGSWCGEGGMGGSPSRMDAWSSSELGWLKPTTITAAPSLKSLPTVGGSATGTAYRVYPGGASSGSEYFLVENRQNTGTDSYLPGDGLLVWHVDEAKRGYADQNDDYTHKLVDLEEADGFSDLDSGLNRGTTGDPFPGEADNRLFDRSTSPNSSTYAGADSMLSISGVSDSQDTMTALIGVGTPPDTVTAVIDRAEPNPVTVGGMAYFAGHGSDSLAHGITEYQWSSSLDGVLSTSASFSTSALSAGTHTIYFKVRCANGDWSPEDSAAFEVTPLPVVATSFDRLSVSPSRPVHGRYATFTTVLTPGAGARAGTSRLSLYRWEFRRTKVGGKWKTVGYWRLRATRTMALDPYGHFYVKYKLPYSGKWKVVADYSTDKGYLASTSAATSFTVK